MERKTEDKVDTVDRYMKTVGLERKMADGRIRFRTCLGVVFMLARDIVPMIGIL